VSLLDENAPDEQRLLSALLSRYEPASRPVYNASDVVTVQFGLTLAQISEMVCNCNIHVHATVSFYYFSLWDILFIYCCFSSMLRLFV